MCRHDQANRKLLAEFKAHYFSIFSSGADVWFAKKDVRMAQQTFKNLMSGSQGFPMKAVSLLVGLVFLHLSLSQFCSSGKVSDLEGSWQRLCA